MNVIVTCVLFYLENRTPPLSYEFMHNGVAKLGVARQHLVQKKALFFIKNQVFRSPSSGIIFSFGKKLFDVSERILIFFSVGHSG